MGRGWVVFDAVTLGYCCVAVLWGLYALITGPLETIRVSGVLLILTGGLLGLSAVLRMRVRSRRRRAAQELAPREGPPEEANTAAARTVRDDESRRRRDHAREP